MTILTNTSELTRYRLQHDPKQHTLSLTARGAALSSTLRYSNPSPGRL